MLRHDLPDGSWHYDLLIVPQTPTSDRARPLLSFRLPARTSPLPHEPGCVEFLAEPIGDHRALYLEYEGVIEGDRGRVSRVAAGESGEILTGEKWSIWIEGSRFEAPIDTDLLGNLGFKRV